MQHLIKQPTYGIRPANQTDLPNLLTLIHQKAAFDGCPSSVTATPEKLKNTLFSAQPMAYILLAEAHFDTDSNNSNRSGNSNSSGSSNNSPIGFASYHFTYSTFLAQPSLWLDDIFVESTYRNQGIGTQIIEQLCQIAQRHGCGRIDWTVNVNNAAGIRFYQRMGARLKKEVHLCRLTSDAITDATTDAVTQRLSQNAS